MHGGYRRTFGPESVVELHKNITVQHDDYLRQDDPDKKADALRYMAGYAVQYLHLVPQEKKFTFKETERVLHNSAMNIGEFDPREGSIAFSNLAKYAENLMEQPWRRDFHVIKLTSGFYVHNIAAQLQNAHEILIVMGYVNLDDRTLKLLPNSNFSNLKAVSRDCYIASQECLILSQIWQHVADQEPDYPLTIGEVFEYRKNHLGDTDTICNKLLYDIRQRMHVVKQQQQLTALKTNQRFVPVDRLIDYDVDDAMHADEPDMNFIPEREVERTQDLLKTVNLNYQHHQNDEHIYDPVYGSSVDMPNHTRRHPGSRDFHQKPNNNTHNYNSRKSMPTNHAYPYQHNNISTNIMYSDQRNSSLSPMIPKTVTGMFSSSNGLSSLSSSRNNVSKSNSMNSIKGAATSSSHQNFPTQALTLSKVKETDLDADLNQPRDAYHNHSRVRKSLPENRVLPNNQVYPDEFYPPGIVKPVAVYGSTNNPVPHVPAGGQYYMRPRQNSDNSEDVLNEAYAYASEVNQMPKGTPGRGSLSANTSSPVVKPQIYQHQATPIPMQGSDSDSHSMSSRGTSIQRELVPPANNVSARSGSSTDASSWEGSVLEADYGRVASSQAQQQNVRKLEQAKRPSHIDLRNSTDSRDWRNDTNHQPIPRGGDTLQGMTSQIRYADSSPETDLTQQPQARGKNGYRELSSSSSGSSSSPASSSSLSRNYHRNQDLSSLDTVYYDYLLKQGQTDQVMMNERNNVEQRRTSSTRSSSHHTPNPNNHNNEAEEDHLYDGRRVTRKKLKDSIPTKLEKDEASNNHLETKRKNPPVESVLSCETSTDANYNLSTSAEPKKSVHDKNLKKVSNTKISSKDRFPVESEIPPPPLKPVEPWNCRFCTFLNLSEERICEVCAKSKDFFEDETDTGFVKEQQAYIQPVVEPKIPKMYSVPNNTFQSSAPVANLGVSRGSPEEKECPQCTLLNPVVARICDACNFRLIPAEPVKNTNDEGQFDNR